MGSATWPETSSGSGDAWFNAQTTAMNALVPALATTGRYEYLKAGQLYPVTQSIAGGGTVTVGAPYVAGSIVGGSVGVASDTVYLQLLALPVWQTPRTNPFAICFRCKFPAIASSKASAVGINTGNTVIAHFGWDATTSLTKWYFFASGTGAAATALNADTSEHNVIIASDGTTVTAAIDGVTAATALTSLLTNTACGPAIFSSLSLSPGVQVQRLIYGYVDPT